MLPFDRIVLAVRAMWELCRYDLVAATSGFRGVYRRLQGLACGRRSSHSGLEMVVPRTVTAVSSFYWKRVPCLQRSVVTARLLRQYGVEAQVVIGCRAAPFASHAWVEVNGRVVNDSSGYQQKLRVLERF
ncbi:MAG: lasso peptide biosynthesis B2 protein [Bryobacteraceae bacterium]|jgi:hypothetical protein